MKKILIIMLLALVGLTTYSQKRGTKDASLGYDATWNVFVGANADTLGVGDSVFTRTYEKLINYAVYPYFEVVLDSISGTSDTVDVSFYYSPFGLRYTLDSTMTWYGTADTVIKWQQDTARRADYHKIIIKERGDNFKVGIDTIRVKYTY
jgi:hypothetical protein